MDALCRALHSTYISDIPVLYLSSDRSNEQTIEQGRTNPLPRIKIRGRKRDGRDTGDDKQTVVASGQWFLQPAIKRSCRPSTPSLLSRFDGSCVIVITFARWAELAQKKSVEGRAVLSLLWPCGQLPSTRRAPKEICFGLQLVRWME